MDINELESFKLSDAVKFHNKLNPKIWRGTRLDPAVKKQLLIIAEDFISELGIKGLDVEDITISGSNAAYSYTPHSDLDLHILVDMTKLPDNEVYRELFQAKKNLYNSSHDIKVHGVPVELYVQDTNEPVVSLGEYSVLKDKWIHIPKKRRANFDQNTTKMKFEKLKELVELALKTKSVDKVNDVLKLIKRYRKAGLDKGGEFSPENLAYKAIRTQGGMDQLFALRDKLHSEELTIETMYSGPKMKFLRPGELKGSYTDYQLLSMGFKKAQNGAWYIPKFKWDKLVANQQIGEEENLAEKFAKEFEDYDPNGVPPGPEFKPTMPAGTVKVDVSDVYDWYKLGQHVSNLKGLGKHDFGKGPPSTILSFGDEDTEHKYIQDLEKTGLTTTDIDPIDPKQPKGMPRQKVDPTYNVGLAEGSDNNRISFKVQKGKNKFATTLSVGSDPAGVYQYDADTGRSIAEVYPEFKGKGLGKLLVLHAIYTAAQLGLDFQEDDSRTSTYDNVLDSLSSNGYIVDDDGYWYVTGEGEQYLKQALKQGVAEASGYIPSEKEKNDPRFKTGLTVDVKPDSIKNNAKKLGWKIKRTGEPPLLRK